MDNDDFKQNVEDMNVYEYSEYLELDDKYADVCTTKKQMDAVVWCLYVVKSKSNIYLFNKNVAPHNDSRMESFVKRIADISDHLVKEEYIAEMQTRPLYSQTKEIYNDVKHECITTLKRTGMGNKRIIKLIPILMKELNTIQVEGKSYPH